MSPLDRGRGQAEAQRVATKRLAFRRGPIIALAIVLAAAMGTVTWRRVHDPDRRVGPAPTVVGTECGLGQPPDAVLAVDGDTGRLRWSRLVGDMDDYWPTGVAVARGSVAVYSEQGRIQALAIEDGTSRWCSEGGVVAAVYDRMFTIDGDRQTVELDATTGRTKLVEAAVLTDLLESAAGPIAVQEKPVDRAVQARTLTVTDRASGQILWTKQVPGYQLVTTDSLVLVNDQTNGTSRVGSLDIPDEFTVTAYRLDDGQRAWSRRFPRFGELMLAGDQVYLQGWPDRTIRAIDPDTGKVIWSTRHDNPGQTVRYSEPGDLTAVASDPSTGDVFLLLKSRRPYRD